MKHKIISIQTYIQDKEQYVALQVEGENDLLRAPYSDIAKVTGNLSVLELELLINSYCEPSSYYKKGERMPNGLTPFVDGKFPKSWKIILNGTKEELLEKNKHLLLNFKSISKVEFTSYKSNVWALIHTSSSSKPYWYLLSDLERKVGLKAEEFYLLEGSYIAPDFYKKGESSDYFGNFIIVQKNNRLIAELNFRVNISIEHNHKLYLEKSSKSNQNFPGNGSTGISIEDTINQLQSDLLTEVENLERVSKSLSKDLYNNDSKAELALDEAIKNSSKRFKEIGIKLNNLGSFDLMQSSIYNISKAGYSIAVVEYAWDGIGGWVV